MEAAAVGEKTKLEKSQCIKCCRCFIVVNCKFVIWHYEQQQPQQQQCRGSGRGGQVETTYSFSVIPWQCRFCEPIFES